MIIGVDIDGVLTNYEYFLQKTCARYFKNKICNKNEYFIADAFSINEQEEFDMWASLYLPYIKNAKATKGARSAMASLKKLGHKIIIITNRNNDVVSGLNCDEVVEETKAWLNKNKIKYDEIYFNVGEKAETCKKFKLDVMIEDAPYQINSVSKELPVLILDWQYNRNCVAQNSTRCYSWLDIKKKIIALSQKSNQN